jgi:hypothetical protein
MEGMVVQSCGGHVLSSDAETPLFYCVFQVVVSLHTALALGRAQQL